jgi:uncharacterized RDD family membrane protein YckC
VSEPATSPANEVVPAGFVRRWAAFFIDSLILTAGAYGVFFVVLLGAAGLGGLEALASDEPPMWLIGLQLGLALLYFFAAGLYYSLMESSASQATLGKMALAIKVVDAEGRRLSFLHALGRWAAAALSYLTLYIGFLMAAFTARKQALHDLVAGTQVVDQWAYTAFPDRQKRGPSGCLVVFLIAAMMLPLLAILAAIAIPAYQDYSHRAGVATALAELTPLQTDVTGYIAREGSCPANDMPGFAAAATYASPRLRQVEFYELDDGRCAVVADLVVPPSQAAENRWLELAYDRTTQRWSCRSGLPDRVLPRSCRG